MLSLGPLPTFLGHLERVWARDLPSLMPVCLFLLPHPHRLLFHRHLCVCLWTFLDTTLSIWASTLDLSLPLGVSLSALSCIGFLVTFSVLVLLCGLLLCSSLVTGSISVSSCHIPVCNHGAGLLSLNLCSSLCLGFATLSHFLPILALPSLPV